MSDVECMSDADCKGIVRQRDGYKCTRCGMTNDQHIAEYGRALDVHRCVPRVCYLPFWCVTLCRACHGKMPKTVEAAFMADDPAEIGVAFIVLPLHHEWARRVYHMLKEEAARANLECWEEVAYNILIKKTDEIVSEYVI